MPQDGAPLPPPPASGVSCLSEPRAYGEEGMRQTPAELGKGVTATTAIAAWALATAGGGETHCSPATAAAPWCLVPEAAPMCHSLLLPAHWVQGTPAMSKIAQEAPVVVHTLLGEGLRLVAS